jgi:hypothetical protein
MAANPVAGRYRLTRKILAGDPRRGIPTLWQAEDAGDIYFIKAWRRRGDDRADIKALWNREIRGLTRLQGHPGASELFVRLHDLFNDDRNYYAVLNGGRRILLADAFHARSSHAWLTNLSEVARRRPLWEGLLRVAKALAMLHGGGTLHRSLTPNAVFVAPEGMGDFRLSGFEWSLRISGREGAAASVGRPQGLVAPELAGSAAEYSTATDWFDFGLVAAELLGAPVVALKNREGLRKTVSALSNLRDAERALVLRLLEEQSERRLASGEQVIDEIGQLVRDLGAVTAGLARSVVLAVRLGRDSALSRAVQQASGQNATADLPAAQRQWIAHDLRGDPRIVARALPRPQFVLRGEKLEYVVKAWNLNGVETWDIGFCEGVDVVPRPSPEDQSFGLGTRRLDIVHYPEARRTFHTIRDRAASWAKAFALPRPSAQLDFHLRDVHDFFRITQQVDTVLTAARICPVEVLYAEVGTSGTTVTITPREEPDRNLLAQHLELAPPSEQLRDWFKLGADDEDGPAQGTCQLLYRRTIDSENIAAKWRFHGGSDTTAGPMYRLRCAGTVAVRRGLMYLARDHGGTIAQIKRRHKAIEEMREHENLLHLLADPRGSAKRVGDSPPPARVPIKLDGSKTDALERLWGAQPSFAVQGPPGTGKTTLIQAFADRLLAADPSAQLLLTAHSHHTVDDVRAKLAKLFDKLPREDRPLMLRLGAESPDEHGVGLVTAALLRHLKKSELARRMPPSLAGRLDRVLPDDPGHDEAADIELRTLQMLVQDAANLTFSTMNAPELEELAARGRRFDWAVVEEAGKAHGFDMAATLQLSHRLLLIGDHFQLPPFNSQVFRKLLGDPLRVRKALQAGRQFAPRLVDPAIAEEEEGREPFAARCDRWRRTVNLFGRFFEASLGDDPERPGPAATLTDQHRMHPHIADLVGRVFYPNQDEEVGTILVSPPETHERFEAAPPFLTEPDSWLPAERVVWCDVPWRSPTECSRPPPRSGRLLPSWSS